MARGAKALRLGNVRGGLVFHELSQPIAQAE